MFAIHMSGGGNLLPKFMPISFSGMHLVFGVIQDIRHSNEEILVYPGMLPCLVLNGLKLCKSVSRSDLVLDADHSLDLELDENNSDHPHPPY